MKKKIWIINQYNMPPELGHLNRHYYFAKELHEAGYKPTVFVGSYLHNTDIQMIKGKEKSKRYKNVDFDYIFIKTLNYKGSVLKRGIAMFQFYINFKKVAKKLEKPNVVLGSSAHPLNAMLALRMAKKFRIESIVEVRDLWPESFVAYNIIKKKNPILKLLYYIEKRIYKKANKLIFTMEGGVDYIQQKGWDIKNGGTIDLQKAHHINNGINLSEHYTKKTQHIFDDDDLLNKNTFKVIYVGSVRKVNKIARLIDVCERLKAYEKIVVLVFGEGDERNRIMEIADSKSLDNIVFKGHVDKKYIPFILSNSNLNLIVGENNSLFKYGLSANKMFDYFASCKPTLQTFKTNYSILEKFHAGIELKEYDLQDVVDSILYFYNMNDDEYEKFTVGANNAALYYDFKNLTGKMIEIIES